MGSIVTALFNALIEWMIDGAVKAWETACKLALQAGSMNANQWQIVSETVGKLSMPMLLLTVVFAIMAMIKEVAAGNIGGVWIIFYRAILAWPLTLFTIWLAVMTSNLATSMTGKILNVDMSGGNGAFSLPRIDKPNLSSLTTLMGGLLMLFMIILMILGACSNILCMSARTFMLIIIRSFAGVAWMSINDSSFRTPARYLKYIIGIILYQPLCAVFIYITGRLMSVDGMSNPISFFTGVVGMILASVMPWVLVSMVAKSGVPIPEGTRGVAAAGARTVGTTEKVVKTAAKVAAKAVLRGKGGAIGGGAAGAPAKISGPAGAGTAAAGAAKKEQGTATPSPGAAGPATDGDQSQAGPAASNSSGGGKAGGGVLPAKKTGAPSDDLKGGGSGEKGETSGQAPRPKPQLAPLPPASSSAAAPAKAAAPAPAAPAAPAAPPAKAAAPAPAAPAAPAAPPAKAAAPAPAAPSEGGSEGSSGSGSVGNAGGGHQGRLAGPNHNDG